MPWPSSMSYLFDLFFIFTLIIIAINHIISLKQSHLFFPHFLEYLKAPEHEYIFSKYS